LPPITTNVWEQQSFDSLVGYTWFYFENTQFSADFSFPTSIFRIWNKKPSVNLNMFTFGTSKTD